MNETEFEGRNIRVNLASERPPQQAGGFGGRGGFGGGRGGFRGGRGGFNDGYQRDGGFGGDNRGYY